MKKQNVQTMCEVLAWISMIGGIILGIYLGNKLGFDTNISAYSYKIEQERNVMKTVLYFVVGIGTGFIEYIFFMALHHILNNQLQIEYMLQKFYDADIKTSTVVSSKNQELPPL